MNLQNLSRNASILLAVILMLVSCKSNSGYGELTGITDRNRTELPIPYGMAYVPGGYFTMGAGGDDPSYSQTYNPKSISISSFFMDETEITNNEYRQFIFWVVDSLSRRLLGEEDPTFLIESEDDANPPIINWKTRLKNTPEEREALEPLYTPVDERFYHRREIDTRKINYEYYWYDYASAGQKSWEGIEENTEIYMSSFVNRPQSLRSRAGYIRKEVVNVYPDTLCWLIDFSYSYNDPMVRSYFNSSMYDHYPVVGVNWHQAKAFCAWRSITHNSDLEKKGFGRIEEYRLPTEAEWEYAARGGMDLNPYPWGGPYAMNMNGCLIGNFKPQRGKYTLDGGLYPVIVAHYAPNDFGLYDMMGNVAEWCEDAYSDSYDALHDFNPVFKYDAKSTEPMAMKRKVIRGGSFKDFSEFTKLYARSYEYQDTCKSYIGFRCVMSYLGRDRNDNIKSASNIYK